jgi:hypothetical protein
MRLRTFNNFRGSLRAQTPIMAKVVAHPAIINFTKNDITNSFSWVHASVGKGEIAQQTGSKKRLGSRNMGQTGQGVGAG